MFLLSLTFFVMATMVAPEFAYLLIQPLGNTMQPLIFLDQVICQIKVTFAFKANAI